MVEVDQVLRSRIGSTAARLFLTSVARGEHGVIHLSPGLVRRAVEIDARFRELELGLVGASVIAIAERHRLPILTYDFEDFRAAPPEYDDYWPLVVNEARYRNATR